MDEIKSIINYACIPRTSTPIEDFAINSHNRIIALYSSFAKGCDFTLLKSMLGVGRDDSTHSRMKLPELL